MSRRRILGEWAYTPRFKRPRGYLIRPLPPKEPEAAPPEWTPEAIRKFGIVLDLMIEYTRSR